MELVDTVYLEAILAMHSVRQENRTWSICVWKGSVCPVACMAVGPWSARGLTNDDVWGGQAHAGQGSHGAAPGRGRGGRRGGGAQRAQPYNRAKFLQVDTLQPA